MDGFGNGGYTEEARDKCNLIVIQHNHEGFSGYAHLQKGIVVEEGQPVNVGDLLGYSGESGYCGYPHLHYQTMIEDLKGGYQREGGWTTIPTRFKIGNKVEVLISPKD